MLPIGASRNQEAPIFTKGTSVCEERLFVIRKVIGFLLLVSSAAQTVVLAKSQAEPFNENFREETPLRLQFLPNAFDMEAKVQESKEANMAPSLPEIRRASSGYFEPPVNGSGSAGKNDRTWSIGVRGRSDSYGKAIASVDVSDRAGIEVLVDEAINSHPSVAARKADLIGAEADVQTAFWQYFPAPSVAMRRDDRGKNAIVMSLQQPIWAGGRIDAVHDVAMARASSAAVSILEARHNLAIAVAGAYQSWMQFEGRASELSRSITFHEDQVKRIRRRVEGGVTAEVDLELGYSRLAQVKADLAAAQSASRLALSRLSQLVGKPLSNDDVARGRPERVEEVSSPYTLEALIKASALANPTLRRLDADLKAAQHEVRIKRASMWPTLNLRAEREQSDSLISSSGSRTDNRLLVTVDFAPGSGLTSVSATDSAQARVLSLSESKESAYRDMVDRVSADYEDYSSAKKRRLELMRTRKAASDVLASYSRQFEAGKRGWLDVMNAARELTQVEMSLADMNAQIVAAAYRLKLHAGQPEWYVVANDAAL